jgi:hypothetical protein
LVLLGIVRLLLLGPSYDIKHPGFSLGSAVFSNVYKFIAFDSFIEKRVQNNWQSKHLIVLEV